jgi:hypothetical protein
MPAWQHSDDWEQLEASLCMLSRASNRGMNISGCQQVELEELVQRMEASAALDDPKVQYHMYSHLHASVGSWGMRTFS